MENRNMSFEIEITDEERDEQEKIKKFFDKLLDNSVKKVAAWTVVWIFLFIVFHLKQ